LKRKQTAYVAGFKLRVME